MGDPSVMLCAAYETEKLFSLVLSFFAVILTIIQRRRLVSILALIFIMII